MNIKLVADSSANLLSVKGADFSAVPLKIVVGESEFVDHAGMDTAGMLRELKTHKGPTSTACPGVQDWLDAFGDAEIVYGVSITSALSACYSTALIAAEEYMDSHPGRKVFILDSLTTGPEMELVLEKYSELINDGRDYDAVCAGIKAYLGQTGLLFTLGSLDNFAKNGRVSPAVAKAVGVLGIRIVGKASAEGTLAPLHKCRGERGAVAQMVKEMERAGYRGGKVRISHTENGAGAKALAEQIVMNYPGCDIRIRENRGLCSYYAERGGILLGYEKASAGKSDESPESLEK